MSKSKGNFLLLGNTVKEYSCDATRISLADAGDGLEDANFVRKTSNEAILKLTNYIAWVKNILKNKNLRTGKTDLFADKAFENRINDVVKKAKDAYSNMRFRDALRYSFFDFQQIKDDYIIDVAENEVHQDLIMKFIELQCVIVSPITPYTSEYIWRLIGKKTSINKQLWPVVGESDLRI